MVLVQRDGRYMMMMYGGYSDEFEQVGDTWILEVFAASQGSQAFSISHEKCFKMHEKCSIVSVRLAQTGPMHPYGSDLFRPLPVRVACKFNTCRLGEGSEQCMGLKYSMQSALEYVWSND
jgi:hypothetical protein